jgi:hypothetical protein
VEEVGMELLTSLGLAIPAGLNAYIPLLAVAIAQRTGFLHLKEPYSLLGEWWVIALVGVLLLVEIVADKFPVVDHVNDVVQSVIRPAAGGLLFVAVSQQAVHVHPALLIVAGVLVAGAVHAAKATTRPLVNVSTAGMGAPIVSTIEDVIAAVTSVLAIVAPFVAGGVVLVVVAIVLRMYVLGRRKRVAAGVA